MNKIYKVVWNKARNCYVVASEFAKNHSTSSVTKKKVSIAAILAAGMLSGFSPMVSGAANITDGSSDFVIYGDNNTVSSSNSVTLGNKISSLGGVNVAIGYGSKAGNQDNPKGPSEANGATAVGTGSQATNYRATALGDYTVASGTDSLGVGTTAQATGDRSISAGLLSKASGVNAIAIGDKTESISNDTVAIGEKAKATNSQSIAIGSSSSSSGSYSVAIGLNAKATNGWSVALGNSSETAAVVSTRTMTVGGKTYQTAGGSAFGTVSVGNKNIKRTVTNVAAGRVSRTSTDAINGSQLFAINQSVDANTQNIAKGMNFAADTGTAYNAQLGDTVSIKGDGKNLSTSVDKGTITVHMSDTPVFTSVTASTITGNTIKAGDTVTLSQQGADMGGTKITHLKDGDVSPTSTDAVNGSQLYETNQAIANNATNISSLSHSISNLDNRVNKVGAGAAALAALHPLDFDPDAKWDFAAGYGNYRGTNAAAVGAYYRPNEDTMFSVGGTFGNGENMVNAGVSFKLGAGSSHVSTSRVAMAKEIKELRAHMAAQDKLIAQLTGPVNALTGSHIQADLNTLFPDVPKNHWAYDYVTKLAQAGYIEGYPDGNFKGDAMMTRYEFAAVIYRAMMNGAARDAKLGGDENLNKLLKEFEPELEYIRIDTIAKDKAGNPTIQRVRTVKANTNK